MIVFLLVLFFLKLILDSLNNKGLNELSSIQFWTVFLKIFQRLGNILQGIHPKRRLLFANAVLNLPLEDNSSLYQKRVSHVCCYILHCPENSLTVLNYIVGIRLERPLLVFISI